MSERIEDWYDGSETDCPPTSHARAWYTGVALLTAICSSGTIDQVIRNVFIALVLLTVIRAIPMAVVLFLDQYLDT